MSTDGQSHDDRPAPPAPRSETPRSDAARSAEESLNDALNHLERMLEERGRKTRERTDDDQYVIPLLDEVALPDHAPDRRSRLLTEDPELCRRIAERLASEVEVIVNTRMESAVRKALDDAQRQLRDHLYIVLPELLEDLLHSSPPDED